GHVPATSDRQGPQPRQCLVLHARQRMAGAQGRLRALARAAEFRRGGTAADKFERVEPTSCSGRVEKRNETRDPATDLGVSIVSPLGPDSSLAPSARSSGTRE